MFFISSRLSAASKKDLFLENKISPFFTLNSATSVGLYSYTLYTVIVNSGNFNEIFVNSSVPKF